MHRKMYRKMHRKMYKKIHRKMYRKCTGNAQENACIACTTGHPTHRRPQEQGSLCLPI